MNTINFEANLVEIKRRIAEEEFDSACVQLHGLVYLFPKEIFLREILAEVYAQLDNPVMAGHYWYLVENKTPEIAAACGAFEDKYDNDLMKIFDKLLEGFKYEKENIIGTAAEKPLRELQAKAFEQKAESLTDLFIYFRKKFFCAKF